VIEIGILTLAAFLAGAALAGCPSITEPGANEVLIREFAFDPGTITIEMGESITWRNVGNVSHTATSGNPGDADLGSVFRSELLAPGDTFTHRFDEPGDFVYFCETHPTTMRGAHVVVEAP